MSVSEKIRKKIEATEELDLFSLDDLGKNESHFAISKELSRLCAAGKIRRLMNGIYYRPKISRFGELKPSESNILKYLLFDNNRQIGYISGERLFNSMGLTSQISGVITIATNHPKKHSWVFSNLRVRFVKAYGKVRKENIKLHQILDVLKDISHIPDASIKMSLQIIFKKIQDLEILEKEELLKLAQEYPPRVKAIVGAMLESIWQHNQDYSPRLKDLRSSIINTSKFFYPIDNTIFIKPQNWHIYEPSPKTRI